MLGRAAANCHPKARSARWWRDEWTGRPCVCRTNRLCGTRTGNVAGRRPQQEGCIIAHATEKLGNATEEGLPVLNSSCTCSNHAELSCTPRRAGHTCGVPPPPQHAPGKHAQTVPTGRRSSAASLGGSYKLSADPIGPPSQLPSTRNRALPAARIGCSFSVKSTDPDRCAGSERRQPSRRNSSPCPALSGALRG